MNFHHFLNALATRPLEILILLGIGLFFIWLSTWRLAKRKPNAGRWTIAWAGPTLAFGLLAASLAATVIATRPQMWKRLQDYADSDKLQVLQKAGFQENPALAALPGDWPQWRGPKRDGVSPASGLLSSWPPQGPPILWRKPLGGGYSSIALVNDLLYTMARDANSERVICLDAASGNEVWTYRYEVDYSRVAYGEGPRATPLVFDNRVYTVGATGIFLCLEAKPADPKPKLLWQHDLLREFDAAVPQWGVAGSPLIEGDLVIVQPGGTKGSVVAFDRRTGRPAWTALTDLAGYSSPVAATCAGVRQIIALTAAGLAGLRPADGTVLWQYPWTTSYDANIATPIVAGDYVFVSSGYNTGCALLELSKGGPDGIQVNPVYVKSNKVMRSHHSTCVFHNGYLYGFDNDRLKCVDLKTADEKWLARDVAKGSLILADGHLIILTEQGQLILADATPDEFRRKGQAQLFETANVWALPALAAGQLYARDNREIVALSLKKP